MVQADHVERLPPTRVRSRNAKRFSPWRIAPAVIVVAASTLVFAAGSARPIPLDAVTPTSTPNTPVTNVDPAALTVRELLAAIENGTLSDASITVTGYWSGAPVAHSCAPPSEPVGALEIYCHDGEYGIAQLAEHIITIGPNGFAHTAKGEWITPLVDDEAIAELLFDLPRINGQLYPPVPIVATGHVNDPRAIDCGASARQLCLDRFVLDEVVEFEPEAVATPAPTPPPTPFPFDAPPPPLFDATACAGDVAYSFVGWTRLQDLGLDSMPHEIAYAAVTRDVITTDWTEDDQDPNRAFRSGGRRYCYATEGMGSEIRFGGYLPGTGFIEYNDGTKTPIG